MKTKLYLFMTAIMCILCVCASAAQMDFTDVQPDAWYYNDVKTAVENGLINGKTPTTYCPDDYLTYAEAIKLASCMHQRYTQGEVTLTNGEPWYQSYVDYCKTNGIITKEYDYSDEAYATRAEYIEIFANALPLAEINTVDDDAVPDVPASESYASAVYKMYRAGIVAGVDEQHNFFPNDNILRSEVAAILTRMTDENARIDFSLASSEKPEIPAEPVVPEKSDEELIIGKWEAKIDILPYMNFDLPEEILEYIEFSEIPITFYFEFDKENIKMSVDSASCADEFIETIYELFDGMISAIFSEASEEEIAVFEQETGMTWELYCAMLKEALIEDFWTDMGMTPEEYKEQLQPQIPVEEISAYTLSDGMIVDESGDKIKYELSEDTLIFIEVTDAEETENAEEMIDIIELFPLTLTRVD